MTAPVLEFEDVTTGYGATTVLRGISGTVEAGEVLCVLGRNGVGKSALMKAISGFLPCWRGTLRFNGGDFDKLEPVNRRRLGITYCPQERPVFESLSVRTNLLLMRADRNLAAFDRYFERFPILSRRLAQPLIVGLDRASPALSVTE